MRVTSKGEGKRVFNAIRKAHNQVDWSISYEYGPPSTMRSEPDPEYRQLIIEVCSHSEDPSHYLVVGDDQNVWHRDWLEIL